MKIFAPVIGIVLGALAFAVLLMWGISAVIYYPWANDCKNAGHHVQKNGYGIPMVSTGFWCVSSDGRIVDTL